MKIIVIDDENDALSNFLFHIIDEKNIEYKMFRSDPLSALEYIKNNPVDAAFLDINMPQINGVELAERFVKINEKIKIVFTSGYTQDERSIKKRLSNNLIGFCYKPYHSDMLFGFIKQIADEIGDMKQITLRTFGAFELFADNKIIKFSSAKSKELLALIVDKNGAELCMNEAISLLWPDKNAELAKILYRDAVWRLRQTLADYSLNGLVTFSRAKQVINKDGLRCDYWDFLNGTNKEQYSGVYMPNYDWSMETQILLDNIKAKKKQ